MPVEDTWLERSLSICVAKFQISRVLFVWSSKHFYMGQTRERACAKSRCYISGSKQIITVDMSYKEGVKSMHPHEAISCRHLYAFLHVQPSLARQQLRADLGLHVG